jgi:hypothetical protein
MLWNRRWLLIGGLVLAQAVVIVCYQGLLRGCQSPTGSSNEECHKACPTPPAEPVPPPAPPKTNPPLDVAGPCPASPSAPLAPQPYEVTPTVLVGQYTGPAPTELPPVTPLPPTAAEPPLAPPAPASPPPFPPKADPGAEPIMRSNAPADKRADEPPPPAPAGVRVPQPIVTEPPTEKVVPTPPLPGDPSKPLPPATVGEPPRSTAPYVPTISPGSVADDVPPGTAAIGTPIPAPGQPLAPQEGWTPAPAVVQAAPAVVTPPTCPWTLRMEIVDGRTHVEARIGNDVQFLIVCQRLDLQAPRGSINAQGEVRISGSGLDGHCDHLTINWQDDHVLLEGKAQLKCLRDGQDVELQADRLSLKLSASSTVKGINTGHAKEKKDSGSSDPTAPGTVKGSGKCKATSGTMDTGKDPEGLD